MSIRSRLASGFATLLLAAGLGFVASPVVHAAPNPNIGVQITNFMRSDANGATSEGAVRVDEVAKLEFTWSGEQANIQAQDSFSIEYAPYFEARVAGQRYPMTVPVGGVQTEIGTCEVAKTVFTCTFSDKVVELRQQGFAEFRGTGSVLVVAKQSTNTETVEMKLNEKGTAVDLPGSGGIGEKATASFTPVKLGKYATPIAEGATQVNWNIGFHLADINTHRQQAGLAPLPTDGAVSTLKFTDRLGPGQTLPSVMTLVMRTRENPAKGVVVAQNGKPGTDYKLEVTYNEDKTQAEILVTGPFSLDSNYAISYSAPITDAPAVPGVKYKNDIELGDTDYRVSGERYLTESFSITVEMEPGFGGFDITKFVGGEAATSVVKGTKFTVSLDYALPAGSTVETYSGWAAPGKVNAARTGGTATFEVKLGAKTPFPGTFPQGTTVTLREDPKSANPAVPGGVWEEPIFKRGRTETATFQVENQKSTAFSLDNSVRIPKGAFHLAKTVQGAQVPADKEFTFNYTCGNQNGTLKAKAGGPAVASPLFPAGTKCTIVEDEASAQLDGHVLQPPAAQEVTVGENANAPVAVTFVNSYTPKTGRFSVAKLVVGTNLALGKEFVFNYTCGDVEGSLKVLGEGDAVVSPEFPVGTECRVSEDVTGAAVPGYNVIAPDPQVVTISDAVAPTALTFTNTYRAKLGSFSVTKDVEGGPFASDSFQFKYTCGDDYAGVLVVPGDGSVVESPLLPAGVKCSLSEDAASAAREGYSVVSSLSADSVKIVDGDVVAVKARNVYSRDLGSFEVVKVVAGDGAGIFDGDVFEVGYVCNDAAKTSGVLRVPGDGSAVTSPQVPAGTECVLSESEATRARDGYAVAAVFDVPSVRVVKGDPVRSTLTNTYTQLKGSFSVAKSVAGDGAVVAGKDFVFDYSCVDDAGKKTVADSVTVTAGGAAVSVADVPVGKCVVTERDAEVAGTVLETKLSADGVESVGSSVEFPVIDGASVEVAAVNTYTLERGQFSVAKSVSGDGALQHAKRSFVFDYVCDTVEGEKRGDVSVPGDGSVVTVGERLPVGASCVVTERAQSAQVAGFDVKVPEAKTVKVGAAGEVVALAFDNAYARHTGSFSVAKKVAGHPGLAGHEFKFEYVCGDVTGSLLVKGDGVAVPAGVAVPTGTKCKVSEVADSAQVSGWDVKVPAGQEFLVMDKGQVVEVSFVNEYTEQPKASPSPSPSASVTPGPSAGPSQGPSGSPSAAPGGKLPKTGVDALGLGLFAGAVLAGGVALAGLSRRRAAR